MKTTNVHKVLGGGYDAVIRRISDDLGGGYTASIPRLGMLGCVGDGETPEEALQNLEIVRRKLIADWEKKGMAYPGPNQEGEN